jgi:hypothetical protein
VSSKYLKKNRLADVLALIQVLALDEDSYRSEKGLEYELQGKPSSATSWLEVGRDHPEFFRVNSNRECPVSLVSRHVTPKIEDQRKLDPGFIQILLNIAVELHDREAKRHDRAWGIIQTVVAGFVGGAIPYVLRWFAVLGTRL